MSDHIDKMKEKRDSCNSCFNCQYGDVKYFPTMCPPEVTCRLTGCYMFTGRFNCPHFVRRK